MQKNAMSTKHLTANFNRFFMYRPCSNLRPIFLSLQNGMVFEGESFGAEKEVCGELIFNTSMTGYQEILTDPSYEGQIIIFSSPHIGITGINDEDCESPTIHAKGIIIRDYPPFYSNWRATKSLGSFLNIHNIPAGSGFDTRALVNILRETENLWGCITFEPLDTMQIDWKIAEEKEKNKDKNKAVSKKNIHISGSNSAKHYLIVYDFGVKRGIIEHLKQVCRNITIVPYDTDFESLVRLKPDGVVLSNGPGNPQDYKKAILVTKQLLQNSIPILGICLGHQILAIACGANTFKMKEGHHGANHPVIEHSTNKVYVTVQNHNFAVDITSLPPFLKITHSSLFDGSLQGFSHDDKLAIGYQGHPEASPGPHDSLNFFSNFLDML